LKTPALASLLLLLVAAYVVGHGGLPVVSPGPMITFETPTEPYGFPAWLRLTHHVNLVFLVLLVRSGLQILADHLRLYWNVHCTPGAEWLRFTPVVAR